VREAFLLGFPTTADAWARRIVIIIVIAAVVLTIRFVLRRLL
jgi:hypothetical protein